MKQRIEYLDGLRGIAILLVIFFHAYARWASLVPYGDQYSEILIFKFGWLGVQLFFMISGFVILMTLENSSTRTDFLYRRWLRLFPAMLACSALIFITSDFFFERPDGNPTWESLLPGLTFIEPGWWAFSLGHPIVSLESAFWSLFVEFKFYVFASIVYFWRGRDTLMLTLICAFLLAVVTKTIEKYFGFGALKVLDKVFSNLSFQYFGWFFSGAAFFIYFQNNSYKWLAIALLATFTCSVVTSNSDWIQFAAATVVSLFFAMSLLFIEIQRILCNKIIQFFGLISYPLYLIHENMMISTIVKIQHLINYIPSFTLPLFAVSIISLLAFLINKYSEPFIKSTIQKLFC